MINTQLNKSDIMYLLTQQGKLDDAMREQHGIGKHDWLLMMNMEHTLALNVEVHEFINSTFKSWKYWKSKSMDMEDVLDEAIDVIHFVMLDLNKGDVDTKHLAKRTAYHLESAESLTDRTAVKTLMYKLSIGNHASKDILAAVLRILDYYGFTTQDIINQYNKKNEINFRRLASNY